MTFAVLGIGGIGRRTLDVSRHEDGLTPVAACDRNGVAVDRGPCRSVCGVLDVRSDKKPTTTTVQVTGRTFDDERGMNTFQLDDAKSMEANLNGPALGYLKAAVLRNRAGNHAVYGPAEILPSC